MTARKKTCALDLPNQNGFMILVHAKQRMLQYYYDFLTRFVDERDIETLEMDTDSLKIAITALTLDEIVKKEKRREYRDMMYNHCGDQNYTAENGYYLCRRCCERCSYVDKFEPGLFKNEYTCSEQQCLNSKTFILSDVKENGKSVPDLVKAKGINKKAIENAKETFTNSCEFS